ncbi:MAG: periplasmic heavy metal sensor [Alphaproteobacteria bacterium]|nr:periplasmic heavy metal sensor [Alphaproteobacteria bacterium]
MSDPTDTPSPDPAGGGAAPPDRPPSRPPGRGRRWLLIGSLTLNAFVLAWLIAGALHWTGMMGPRHWGMGHHASHWYESRGEHRYDDRARGFQAPRGMMRALLNGPPDDPALAALYQAHGAPLQAAFLEARAARDSLGDIVRRAERDGRLDRAALDGALSRMRGATQGVQEHLHAALLDAADSLPPEAFARLLDGRPNAWRN